ncbi:MAG TPA: hypothetical protein VGD36_06455 [Xanthobacteraceae bacterium]|jgi:hypothetical protein
MRVSVERSLWAVARWAFAAIAAAAGFIYLLNHLGPGAAIAG